MGSFKNGGRPRVVSRFLFRVPAQYSTETWPHAGLEAAVRGSYSGFKLSNIFHNVSAVAR